MMNLKAQLRRIAAAATAVLVLSPGVYAGTEAKNPADEGIVRGMRILADQLEKFGAKNWDARPHGEEAHSYDPARTATLKHLFKAMVSPLLDLEQRKDLGFSSGARRGLEQVRLRVEILSRGKHFYEEGELSKAIDNLVFDMRQRFKVPRLIGSLLEVFNRDKNVNFSIREAALEATIKILPEAVAGVKVAPNPEITETFEALRFLDEVGMEVPSSTIPSAREFWLGADELLGEFAGALQDTIQSARPFFRDQKLPTTYVREVTRLWHVLNGATGTVNPRTGERLQGGISALAKLRKLSSKSRCERVLTEAGAPKAPALSKDPGLELELDWTPRKYNHGVSALPAQF